MAKAKELDEKNESSNVGNSKPPQWDGKKGDSYLMWKIKFLAHATMLNLEECFTLDYDKELPAKEKEAFNLTTTEGQKWLAAVKKNKKAMMQFALSFTKVAQLNKVNRATRADPNWPSGKAIEVMAQLVKEYEPDDTMAEMEMENALNKLTLSKKKDPNDINDELSAIECRYKIDLTESKKKAQVLRIRGAQYASVIATTTMIYKSKGTNLTCENLLEEMHNQQSMVHCRKQVST
jgi:hypothetical protein